MSFIKYDNFRGEYKLNVQSIDEMAAKVEDFLYSLGTERANVLGIRLSIEEALLRWYDHFKAKGEEPKVRFYTGKSFFRPVINITLKGESIDPFDGTDDENSSGDWVGTMMANIGLSPRYTYENGINILHLRLSRPQINPGIGLLIGIAAGIIIGLSTRFLLGEADIEMLTDSFFMPVQSVFFRLLQATAGPVIFFTVLTAICGIGSEDWIPFTTPEHRAQKKAVVAQINAGIDYTRVALGILIREPYRITTYEILIQQIDVVGGEEQLRSVVAVGNEHLD